MTVIYKITSPTGKVYIGQSRDFQSRLRQYVNLNSKSQPHLYRSLVKHGIDSHKIAILHECNADIDQFFLNQMEYFYWAVEKGNGKKMLNSREPNGSRGKWSKESRDKLSRTRKGNFKGSQSSMYGKKHSKETKAKMSAALKAYYSDPRNRIKASILQKGKIISPEQRRQISLANKGRKATSETCAKISASAIKRRVIQFQNGFAVKTWDSIAIASKALHLDCSSISKACRNKLKNVGGYSWQYHH